ncbi:M23 family metallopeptidase [bacterium]|nr:M23 family metallopeptidase [bacterium]
MLPIEEKKPVTTQIAKESKTKGIDLSLGLPLGRVRVSSKFGMRMHPTLNKRKMHSGIDYVAPNGTPIKATGDAKVVYIGRRGGYGKFIMLDHGNHITTRYAHMSNYKKGLHKGSRVKKGTVIGYVGSTGRSTGNHLHYEVRLRNRPFNPTKQITMADLKPRSIKVKALTAKNNYLKKGFTLAQVIEKGEAGRMGADAYNRGSDRCRKSSRKNIHVSRMTISTLKKYQGEARCTKNKIYAAGWPQLIPTTLNEGVRYLGLSNKTVYNRAIQNYMFVNYLTKAKRPVIFNYVTTGKGLKKAGRGIAREWASAGSPIHCKIKSFRKVKLKNGKYVLKAKTNAKGQIVYKPWSKNGGCYNSGYGINQHSIHPDKILKALQNARHNYLVYRNRGVSADKAYAYSLGIMDK